MPGILMSSRIRSGVGRRRASSIAFSPLVAAYRVVVAQDVHQCMQVLMHIVHDQDAGTSVFVGGFVLAVVSIA